MGHVLGVMQRLYKEHYWNQWFCLEDIGDLSFQVKDPCRTFQDVCHFCCSALYLHIPKYRLRYHNFKYMLQILFHDPYITYPVLSLVSPGTYEVVSEVISKLT